MKANVETCLVLRMNTSRYIAAAMSPWLGCEAPAADAVFIVERGGARTRSELIAPCSDAGLAFAVGWSRRAGNRVCYVDRVEVEHRDPGAGVASVARGPHAKRPYAPGGRA